MRVLIINSVLGFGSTGRIVLKLAKELSQDGNEVKVAYGRLSNSSKEAEEYGVRIGNDMDVYFHVLYTRLTDKHGLASVRATRRFLKWADDFDPDILWMHNIHDYYINYDLLFSWIKSRPKMQVKWTLHDCWAFTGHCSHFTAVDCNKWKKGCENCPQLKRYPKSFVDSSRSNYARKKAAFSGVHNLTIITPSGWLKEMVKESFLSEYPVEVKYNTIDKNLFKPTPSDFKIKNGIQNKKMVLGVANVWNDRKGLSDFIRLSWELNSDDYQVVLVGLKEEQIQFLKHLGANIIGLPRTRGVNELVSIYSAADIFINPTYEDTFPSVNMEAEACGTRVITYDTGGCRETINRSDSVCVSRNMEAILEEILKEK